MLDITRLTPALGAEIRGVDFSQPLTEALAGEIYSALIDNQVIMFRDCEISPQAMTALGHSLGTLGVRHHTYASHPESPDVTVIEWKDGDRPDAAEWHSDMTYRANPPFASILKAHVVPPSGGDTLWASMTAVYDALDPGILADLEGLEAVHDMGAFRSLAYEEDGVAGIEKAMTDAGTAVHPIISEHPVTGKRFINVSESFTRWVLGTGAPESARLLNYLFDFIKRPECQVRLKWEPNTMAIWDNRGTQHYAVVDYLPHRRVMHRVAVSEDGHMASN